MQRGLAALDDPVEMGLLLENLVAGSLRTLANHAGIRLHHWREGRNEVDLIYDDPRAPLAFEVASSPDHSRAGLEALIERHQQFRGSSFLVAPKAPMVPAQSSDCGIGSLPLDPFLVAVGAQSHRAMMNRLKARN